MPGLGSDLLWHGIARLQCQPVGLVVMRQVLSKRCQACLVLSTLA